MTRPVMSYVETLRAYLLAHPEGVFVNALVLAHGKGTSNVNGTLHWLKANGDADAIHSPMPYGKNQRRMRWFHPSHEATARAANALEMHGWKRMNAPKPVSGMVATIKPTPVKASTVNHGTVQVTRAAGWTHDARFQLDPATAASFKGEFSNLGPGRYL